MENIHSLSSQQQADPIRECAMERQQVGNVSQISLVEYKELIMSNPAKTYNCPVARLISWRIL